MQPRKKIDKLWMIHKICVFCPIAQNFLLVDPDTSSVYFSATVASTYSIDRLGAVASLKFLAIDNMPPHFSAHTNTNTNKNLYSAKFVDKMRQRRCLLWPNGWMDQDTTWYGGTGLGLGDIVLDGDPAPPHTERAQHPHFSVHCFGPHPCRPAFYP